MNEPEASETNGAGGRGDGPASWADRPQLRVTTFAGMTTVSFDGLTLHRFREGDDAGRKMAIAGLAEGGSFEAKEIARAFELDPSTVSYFARRLRDGGAALLLRERGGVPGPRKLTVKEIAQVRAWRREGLKIAEITAKVNRSGREVSNATIGRLVQGIEAETAVQGDLFASRESAAAMPSPPIAEPEPCASQESSASHDSPAPVAPCVASDEIAPAAAPPAALARAPEVVRATTLAGAMVAHAAFDALGLRSALTASGAHLRPAATFDLLRTAAVIAFGVLLRYRSIESLRHLLRDDFGALLGIARAPEIRTVRRKQAELGGEEAGFDGAAFIRDLARTLLRHAAAPDGIYFFDDHFKPYHGERPVAKGWDAKRRICAPGIEDVYVHDVLGRAILFVPLEAPTSLSRAMPFALRELLAVAPTMPSLAVFDRGGFSRELFLSLVHPKMGASRIDFLTYLAKRGKGRELPIEQFRKVALDDGSGLEVEVAESTLPMRGFEKPLRLIVLLDRKKAKQVPILTSDERTPAARLVQVLRSRWGQENSFKYLVGELAIDALVSHDMEMVPDEREVENPERLALRAQLDEAKAALAALDAKLAGAIADNEESRRPSVRGFKIANADLTRPRQVVIDRIEAIRADMKRLPAKVRRASLAPGVEIARPTKRRRVFVNGLKLLVHNSEKWLADRMGPGPYGLHALPILRALFHQPGEIRFLEDRVRVSIRPLDTPRYQRCVERLLAELNRRRATFLDSGKVIEFEIAPSAAG